MALTKSLTPTENLNIKDPPRRTKPSPLPLPQPPPPYPQSNPKSRTQEIACKLLDRSKNIHRRHSQKPATIPPTAPRTVHHPVPVSSHPGRPIQTGPPIMSCPNQLPQADTRPYPDDTGDMAKYTKRHIERAQYPIPGVDLGEEEEALDPEVRTPDDVDFIKPPSLRS